MDGANREKRIPNYSNDSAQGGKDTSQEYYWHTGVVQCHYGAKGTRNDNYFDKAYYRDVAPPHQRKDSLILPRDMRQTRSRDGYSQDQN